MDDNAMRSCCGILPASAPLANPYVPFQPDNADQYEAGTALIRGTLYPCLDLPFLGMVNTEQKPDSAMTRVQALGFAVQELGLYLDTHADDAEAAALFAQYAEMYEAEIAQYRESCGPMFQKQAVQNGVYTWNSTPWPWEYRANQEG